MHSKFSKGSTVLKATGALLALMTAQQACFADQYFDEGLRRYNKKEWKNAAFYFDKSVDNSPWDSNGYYYAAICYQRLGDWNNAKKMYALVIEKFPTTEAGANATAALNRLDPQYLNRKKAAEQQAEQSSSSSSSTSSPTSSASSGSDDELKNVQVEAPQQTRVNFSRNNERMLVDASVNNRSLKLSFGGSDETVLPKSYMQPLGLQMPPGPGERKAGQTTPSWKYTATVKIGGITFKNLPVQIQEGADVATLGKSALDKFFSYTVDNRGNSIVVTKKGSGTAVASGGGYDVPFKKDGKNMMIEVSINGRRVPMVFDTEGSESVVPKKRAREFGIEVQEETNTNIFNPTTNPTGALRGQEGFGESKTTSFSDVTIKIGPIIKSGFRFKLEDNVAQPKIGAAGLGEWTYSIDSSANVIKFKR